MVDGLLQVEGGRPLTGEITVRGAKNLVPKAMVAALLGSSPSVLRNVPLIRDVDVVSGLLSLHGVSIDYDQREGVLQLDSSKVESAHMADIDAQAGSFRCAFSIDDYVRWILMEGLDDISLTLTQEDAIRSYEEARPTFKPRTLPAKHLPAQEVVSARAAEMPQP